MVAELRPRLYAWACKERTVKTYGLDSTVGTHRLGRMLNCSYRSIANWASDGKIPYHMTPGGHRRIAIRDVLEFIARNKFLFPRELEAAKRALDCETRVNAKQTRSRA